MGAFGNSTPTLRRPREIGDLGLKQVHIWFIEATLFLINVNKAVTFIIWI